MVNGNLRVAAGHFTQRFSEFSFMRWAVWAIVVLSIAHAAASIFGIFLEAGHSLCNGIHAFWAFVATRCCLSRFRLAVTPTTMNDSRRTAAMSAASLLTNWK